MDKVTEARTSTILFFFLISLGMTGLFLAGYQGGIVQTIQDSTRGLFHRTLILNIPLILVTVAGILLWYEKLRPQDIGIVPSKLPFAVTLGVCAWIFILVMMVGVIAWRDRNAGL